MRRVAAACSTLALVLAMSLLGASPATAAPYCGITWGSLVKSGGTALSSAPMTNVRTGRHTCFDRVVVDVRGDVAGWRVEYVSRLTQPGSGATVPVRGGARLQVTLDHPAYDASGRATYTPANRAELRDVTGYRTLRQLRWLGSYEGYSDIGVGVRARLPFRVFELDGPGSGGRLVIDVAHRW